VGIERIFALLILKMHAIILFSHGSVLCGAGENLFDFARQMEARDDAPIVEVGFLNYSEPTFETAFEKCVERGATKISVAPYFLVAGYFVNVSLPPKIEAMQQKFPQIEVVTAQALKTHELLAQAILNCTKGAQKPEKWRDLLDDAPGFCLDNPKCPLNGTPKCPLRPHPRQEAGVSA
jgi:sirohydrochlorin ferrochelatase